MEQLTELFSQFVEKYPFLVAALSAIGILRLIFKPLFAAVEKIVADTESKKDDLILEEVKSHWAYRYFVWFLDYVASIKLPVKK